MRRLAVVVLALTVTACGGSDDSPTLHQDDDGSCADPAVECPTTDVTEVTEVTDP